MTHPCSPPRRGYWHLLSRQAEWPRIELGLCFVFSDSKVSSVVALRHFCSSSTFIENWVSMAASSSALFVWVKSSSSSALDLSSVLCLLSLYFSLSLSTFIFIPWSSIPPLLVGYPPVFAIFGTSRLPHFGLDHFLLLHCYISHPKRNMGPPLAGLSSFVFWKSCCCFILFLALVSPCIFFSLY